MNYRMYKQILSKSCFDNNELNILSSMSQCGNAVLKILSSQITKYLLKPSIFKFYFQFYQYLNDILHKLAYIY